MAEDDVNISVEEFERATPADTFDSVPDRDGGGGTGGGSTASAADSDPTPRATDTDGGGVVDTVRAVAGDPVGTAQAALETTRETVSDIAGRDGRQAPEGGDVRLADAAQDARADDLSPAERRQLQAARETPAAAPDPEDVPPAVRRQAQAVRETPRAAPARFETDESVLAGVEDVVDPRAQAVSDTLRFGPEVGVQTRRRDGEVEVTDVGIENLPGDVGGAADPDVVTRTGGTEAAAEAVEATAIETDVVPAGVGTVAGLDTTAGTTAVASAIRGVGEAPLLAPATIEAAQAGEFLAAGVDPEVEQRELPGGQSVVELRGGEEFEQRRADISDVVGETAARGGEFAVENPERAVGAATGELLLGAGTVRGTQRVSQAASNVRRVRGADEVVDFAELTSGRGTRGELPEFQTPPQAPTREAVAEVRERAAQQPDALTEATGTERVLLRSETDPLEGDPFTVGRGEFELPGLFASPDVSPLRTRLEGGRGGVRIGIPRLSDLTPRTERFTALPGDRIEGAPQRAAGSGFAVRGPGGDIVDRFGPGEGGRARQLAEDIGGERIPDPETPGAQFLDREAERGTAFVRPTGDRTTELEAIFPPETQFRRRGEVAVRLPDERVGTIDVFERAGRERGDAGDLDRAVADGDAADLDDDVVVRASDLDRLSRRTDAPEGTPLTPVSAPTTPTTTAATTTGATATATGGGVGTGSSVARDPTSGTSSVFEITTGTTPSGPTAPSPTSGAQTDAPPTTGPPTDAPPTPGPPTEAPPTQGPPTGGPPTGAPPGPPTRTPPGPPTLRPPTTRPPDIDLDVGPSRRRRREEEEPLFTLGFLSPVSDPEEVVAGDLDEGPADFLTTGDEQVVVDTAEFGEFSVEESERETAFDLEDTFR